MRNPTAQSEETCTSLCRTLIGSPSGSLFRWKNCLLPILFFAAIHLAAREKDATQYGMGLIVNVPFPESEVTKVVQEVVQNGMIRGTKEYNKDPYISGATSASSTPVFPQWNEGGKVFYKVRLKALDPRNFKDSSDVGTLAVRYVVQAQDSNHTVLRIDARFVEDFRRAVHPSNGSVESAEYKDIHDHLDAFELMRAETLEAERIKQEKATKFQSVASASEVPPFSSSSTVSSPTASPASSSSSLPSPPSPSAPGSEPASPLLTAAATPSAKNAAATPSQSLEQQVHDLRRQVQRLVKAPGAPLKSAPFHSASTLQSLPTGAEVLIVISTPYWVGIETHDGQHGWMLRDDLEQLP